MKLLCKLGRHKDGKWKSIGSSGKYNERLKRVCERCGKTDIYVGITERCIETGDVMPYEYKH